MGAAIVAVSYFRKKKEGNRFSFYAGNLSSAFFIWKKKTFQVHCSPFPSLFSAQPGKIQELKTVNFEFEFR